VDKALRPLPRPPAPGRAGRARGEPIPVAPGGRGRRQRVDPEQGINQALSALLFLYRDVLAVPVGWVEGVVRAKKPRRLPVVLTRPEVHAVLRNMAGTPRLVASLLYASGLRLVECLTLRVKDVDFAARAITVRSGKGNKDRVTVLADSVAPALRQHLAALGARAAAA